MKKNVLEEMFQIITAEVRGTYPSFPRTRKHYLHLFELIGRTIQTNVYRDRFYFDEIFVVLEDAYGDKLPKTLEEISNDIDEWVNCLIKKGKLIENEIEGTENIKWYSDTFI